MSQLHSRHKCQVDGEQHPAIKRSHDTQFGPLPREDKGAPVSADMQRAVRRRIGLFLVTQQAPFMTVDNIHLQAAFQLLGLELLKEKHYRTQLLDELYKEVKQVTMKELRELAKVRCLSSLAQPSPAQPSPAQPSPAQPSPAQPSPVLPCLRCGYSTAFATPLPLVDHAEQWVEQAVLVSPRLALGVVAAFRRRRQKHYSPAFAAAFALDPANYKCLAPGTHPRPPMRRLQPSQQEDVVTVVASLAECSLETARRELTLLTLGDWPTDMKSSVEAIVAETRTDEDGKTTTACISVRRGLWTFQGAGYFPHLRQAAVRLLSMHVTTAAAERNWSSWGNTYNAGRSQLNVATAGKMVYIEANIPSTEPTCIKCAKTPAEGAKFYIRNTCGNYHIQCVDCHNKHSRASHAARCANDEGYRARRAAAQAANRAANRAANPVKQKTPRVQVASVPAKRFKGIIRGAAKRGISVAEGPVETAAMQQKLREPCNYCNFVPS
ncbi:hypothetical protein QJQ45_007212 [Haematococcus lacustris]|nr:hypothetical protein QJQ45_007212 [Haematococcus lacustris]